MNPPSRWGRDPALTTSVVVLTVGLGVCEAAGLLAAHTRPGGADLGEASTAAIPLYLVSVVTVSLAHRRIRRQGVGHAPLKPSRAALVTVGVGFGAVGSRERGAYGAAISAVAGMSLLWVAHVVVRSRVGSRRLGSPAGGVATEVRLGTPLAPVVPRGTEPEQDADDAAGPIAAAAVSGAIALAMAVAKVSQSWVAVVIAIVVVLGIPPSLDWWSGRRTAGMVRSPRPIPAGTTGATTMPADTVATSEQLCGAPRLRTAPTLDADPRALALNSRSGHWWGGISLAIALAFIVEGATLDAAQETAIAVMVSAFTVFFAVVGILFLRMGMTADDRALVLTNVFKEVTIPWSELTTIEFTAVPGPVFSGMFYRMVLVTREPRRIGVDGITGGKEPGHLLHDVQTTLIAMRDAYAGAP